MAGTRQENTAEIKPGERCPGCGGLLEMIGRRHRCVADDPTAGVVRTLRAEVPKPKPTQGRAPKRASEPRKAAKPARMRAPSNQSEPIGPSAPRTVSKPDRPRAPTGKSGKMGRPRTASPSARTLRRRKREGA